MRGGLKKVGVDVWEFIVSYFFGWVLDLILGFFMVKVGSKLFFLFFLGNDNYVI